MKKSIRGFTIVELLIVIVVIAILAAITIVAYNGFQQRARDSARVVAIHNIQQGLNAYLVLNGQFPDADGADGDDTSWEESIEPNFLQPLVTANIMSKVPVDPINSNQANGTKQYRYFRYVAGLNGCPASKGRYYVIGIKDMESSGRPYPTSPGFSCSGRDWQIDFDWVTGGFENPNG